MIPPRPAARASLAAHDGLAGAAAQLRANMLDHLEVGRDVFEHFAFVIADAAEGGAAAAGAGTGRLMDDGLARQTRRQRRAHRLAARPLVRVGETIPDYGNAW
nr:hypothetical protein [Rhodovastum atsumiense]